MSDFESIRDTKRLVTEALQKVATCDLANEEYGHLLDNANDGLDSALEYLETAMARAPAAAKPKLCSCGHPATDHEDDQPALGRCGHVDFSGKCPCAAWEPATP